MRTEISVDEHDARARCGMPQVVVSKQVSKGRGRLSAAQQFGCRQRQREFSSTRRPAEGGKENSTMGLTQLALNSIIDGEATTLLKDLETTAGKHGHDDLNFGVAVAFAYPAQPDEFAQNYVYGYADQAGNPVTENTIFGIGS